MKLITLQSTNGQTIQVCERCYRAMESGEIPTPKDWRGAEYCQVSRGLTLSGHQCAICIAETTPA